MVGSIPEFIAVHGIIVYTLLLSAMVVILIFGAIVYDAYRKVSQTPRREMQYCPKHGILRPKEIVTMLDQPRCGKCYFEAYKQLKGEK